GSTEDAIAAYDKSLSLKHDLAEAWFGLGKIFFERAQYSYALTAFDRTLEFKPDSIEAWTGRAGAALYSKRYDEVIFSFQRALTLDPDLTYATALGLMAKLYLCDWENLQADSDRLLSSTRRGKPDLFPFVLLAIQS